MTNHGQWKRFKVLLVFRKRVHSDCWGFCKRVGWWFCLDNTWHIVGLVVVHFHEIMAFQLFVHYGSWIFRVAYVQCDPRYWCSSHEGVFNPASHHRCRCAASACQGCWWSCMLLHCRLQLLCWRWSYINKIISCAVEYCSSPRLIHSQAIQQQRQQQQLQQNDSNNNCINISNKGNISSRIKQLQ